MTTAIDYDFTDVERRILSDLIRYSIKKCERRIERGEMVPYSSFKRSLSELYDDLQESGKVSLDDCQQLVCDEIRWQFLSKSLLIAREPDVINILMKYKRSHIRQLRLKLEMGKRYITSITYF